MRWLSLVVTLFVGGLLVFASADFPAWGDPESPASRYLSPYYIEHAYEQTHVPNLVSAILADYRNYDTMLETTVIFTAGMAIVGLLVLPLAPLAMGRRPRDPVEHANRISPLKRDPIIEEACRVLYPPIQLFALYVLAHGHYSPGGGFQGGVIMGASFVMLAICFDLKTAMAKLRAPAYLGLAALGVMLYAGTGVLCMALGGNFFDYAALTAILPLPAEECRSLGILIVETGVAITVSTIIFSIYADLASEGAHRGGL